MFELGDERRNRTVEWLASRFMPHEQEARARLRRMGSRPHEIDDIIQDAYVQIAQLEDVTHIRDGRAYLLATVRTVLLQRVRRERIVSIRQLMDGEAMGLVDEAPDPERRAQARDELDRVFRMISELPPRCRQVVEMRRIDGLSLAEIAERLGISEKVAEHETYRGLRMLLTQVGATEPVTEKPKARTGLSRLVRRRGRFA